MKCRHQPHYLLPAILAAASLAAFSLAAQSSGSSSSPANVSVPSKLVPPLPVPSPHSPVDFFRNLLAMSPAERDQYLANKPLEIRKRILDKVHEYLALDPNERELRLRATELRWYLLPLLHDSPTNRAARLALIPDDLQGLVKSRLEQWDALPPEFRKEFLDNERTLRYFARVDATNTPDARGAGPTDEDQARWGALSATDRSRITNQFNRFFTLTPDEKQKTLNTLSDAERGEMEKTLQSFDKLPPGQRLQCIHAFTEFAGMKPSDRAEFLKNAQRWSQMAPKERQAWRDLVAQVPLWPPVPRSLIMPPLPPKPQSHIHPLMATNLN